MGSRCRSSGRASRRRTLSNGRGRSAIRPRISSQRCVPEGGRNQNPAGATGARLAVVTIRSLRCYEGRPAPVLPGDPAGACGEPVLPIGTWWRPGHSDVEFRASAAVRSRSSGGERCVLPSGRATIPDDVKNRPSAFNRLLLREETALGITPARVVQESSCRRGAMGSPGAARGSRRLRSSWHSCAVLRCAPGSARLRRAVVFISGPVLFLSGLSSACRSSLAVHRSLSPLVRQGTR